MNGNLKRSGLLAAALLVCAGLASSAQGASFDCGKARTTVEMLICADAALSKLDEKLNVAYKIALKKYGQTDTTRSQQAQWLKDRNSCESKGCLKALYEARLQELSIAPAQFNAMPPTVLVDTSDKPVFDNEADKLKFMRYIANQNKFQPTELTSNKEFCQQFFDDFVKGEQLEAVEPDVRASDVSDSRLEKWHSCEDKSAEDRGAEYPFDYIFSLGGPPFRYYRIDLDGNPDNGKEDVIYTDYEKTDSSEYRTVGHNGYYWVDLEGCEVKGSGSVTSLTPLRPLLPNVYHLNTIVKYRGGYLTVDLIPSGRPYSLDVSPMDMRLVGQMCLWQHSNR